MSIILNGQKYEVPGVRTISYEDDPTHVTATAFKRARVHPVQFIVLHSTGDMAVQHVTPGSLTPSNEFAWANALKRESDAQTASWDATVNTDGTVIWNNDPVRFEDYHATSMNPLSMGIELAQGPDGAIYQVQIDALVKLLNFLTEYFGVQREIPWRNGAPDRRVMARMKSGGVDYTGIIGHRNGDDNRSDPGDGVFVALHDAGYEGYDLVAGEDRGAWSARQAALGITPVDGVPGPATRAVLAANGYPGGVFARLGDGGASVTDTVLSTLGSTTGARVGTALVVGGLLGLIAWFVMEDGE